MGAERDTTVSLLGLNLRVYFVVLVSVLDCIIDGLLDGILDTVIHSGLGRTTAGSARCTLIAPSVMALG